MSSFSDLSSAGEAEKSAAEQELFVLTMVQGYTTGARQHLIRSLLILLEL